MINFTTIEKNKINDLIKHTLNNETLELEIMVLKNENLVHQDFINIIKKMKGLGLKNISQKDSLLNVNFENEPNIRMSIHGDSNINEYCNHNNIKDIKESIEFLEKKRFSVYGKQVKALDLRNYNLRVNLKDEKNLTLKSKRIQGLINKISGMNKYFRYKKIYSFLSKDNLFRFDITLVKSSTQEEIVLDKKKLPKKEVTENLKRLVIKPKGINMDFTDWWDTLGDEEILNLRADKYYENHFYKNLRESGTLNNIINYEIEIEFLGNKDKSLIEGKTVLDKQKFILDKLKDNILILQQALQQNEFVITNQEKKQVKDNFLDLTGQYRFTDCIPLGITLELDNIRQLNNKDYKNSINIRRQYCVTDKGDGERNLMFIDNQGEVFLVDRNQEIKKVGLKCLVNSNCLIDGEYITKNINGSKVRKYLAFDLYFSNGNDFRERILNRSFEEREDNTYEKSRLEELEDLLNSLSLEKEQSKIEFEIVMKTFRYGDMMEYDSKTQSIIDKYESAILQEESLEKPNMKLITKLKEDINDALQDNKIFIESNKILSDIASDTLDYKTDGLIFTPVKMTVGEGETKRNKYGGRWNRIFKWKPVEENSIDFMVVISKDSNGNEIEKYLNDGEEIEKYKKVKLLVGYDTSMNITNGLRVVNEDPEYSKSYSMIPFEPTNPFVNKVYETFIKIGKNGLVCENGDVIKDKNIVEFSYKKDSKICWNPMRVRDSTIPNAFTTANNVWNTIYNPITIENITTGNNIDNTNMYYNENRDKQSIFNNVYKFHNLVKKNLIELNTKNGDSLLDLSCGELGDLLKWISNSLSSVLAIDISKNNLINTKKGASTRLIELQDKNRKENKENELLNNIFIVWGDSSRNIRSGDAGLDSINKFYLDNLFGNVINRNHIHRLGNDKIKNNRGKFVDGFDVVSCQFSLHYFFKNLSSLKELLLNVSENLKLGGKFIATCFDGSKLFKLLESNDKLERYDKNDKLIWKIEKKYNDKKLLNSEKCLGLGVDVYVETFYSKITEYLVNIEYLRLLGEEYGLEISSVKKFDDYYKQYTSSSILQEPLSKEGKEFSDLNITLVMEKKKDINKNDLKGGGILDAFLTTNYTKEGDVESQEEGSDMESQEEGSDVESDVESELENQEEKEVEIKAESKDKTKEDKKNELNIEELPDDIDLSEKFLDEEESFQGEKTVTKVSPDGSTDEANSNNNKENNQNLKEESKVNVDGEKDEENNDLEEIEWKDDEDQNKKSESKLDITKLSDIELGPDLQEVDINNLYDANLGFNREQRKQQTIEEPTVENIDLNSINMEMAEINNSVLNIKKDTSDGLNLPKIPVNKDVKVIRLDVDKNTANMINK